MFTNQIILYMVNGIEEKNPRLVIVNKFTKLNNSEGHTFLTL